MKQFFQKTSKLALALVGALLLMVPAKAMADNDTPVTFKQLPANAKTFITAYFSASDILLATVDKEFMETTYTVKFKNGSELEFFKNGEWKEVDCKTQPVPAQIIDPKIAAKVKELYPDASIYEIKKDKLNTEVKLSNGLELKFDKVINLIEVDD